MPIIIMHGSADDTVPFSESDVGPASDGQRENVRGSGGNEAQLRMFMAVIGTSVRSWVESWARRNGCSLIDPAVESGSAVETTAYRKRRAGGDVVLQVIEGGGHDRPLSPGSDATAQALSFFASHPFPPMSSADTRFLRIAFPSATLPLARAFELN